MKRRCRRGWPVVLNEPWFDIEAGLRCALADGFDIVHAHVFAEGDHNRYVQFAFGPGEIYAEAVSNQFLDAPHQLDCLGQRKLRALGWLPPVRSVQNERGQQVYPNWYRYWKGSRPPLDEIVEVTIRTLRDVYFVPRREVRVTGRNCDWCAGDAQAS